MALLRKMTFGLLCFLLSVHFGYSQTVCPAGSYGPSCLLDCDNTCVTDGCTVTDADTCGCDKDTGRCSKCISGYYTDECDVLCVPGCDGACARSTGNCEKCVSQTYGDKCDLNCNNCPYGCDQVSGTCLSGCQVENCMSCVESITTCDYCTDGYGLDEDGTTCCSDGCISQDTFGYPECQPHTGLCKYSNCKGEQFYGEYCQRCNTRIPNCETCGLDTVTDTLECLTCSPPYVPTSTGASCCPEGCDSCDELICTSCKPGWFLYDTRCDTCGDYCTPPTDGSERCDSVTGGCLFGCLQGWHGSACDVECTIEYCNTCAYDEANNDLTCADCADTWYGDQCASCFNLQCDPAGECDQNGVCQGDCQAGYRGATCVERCDAVAGMENCDECHRTDQLCTLCKPGYFGPTCGEACSDNCVADNFGDRKCDLNTGACDNQCDPGYWQEDCRIACPNCASGSCNITSGYCQPKVCSQGFYGVMCNQPCPEECASNPNTLQLECDVDTGVCTHGCAYNFYGDFCNNYCHENCSTKNSAGDIVGTDEPLCSQSDGACHYGCVNGSYTPQCSKSCISSCVWDYCDITSGICQACHDNPPGWHCINADCPSGKHDKYCDEQCHPNCVDTCARYSSFCDACRVGWHGENCQTQCGECSGSSCFQYNGTCQSECNTRFYGETCNSRCPDDTCNYCNRETGICETCQPGLWGTTCDQSCSTSCEPSTDGLLYCDIGTGDCGIKTCRPGYWGSDCRANCPAHCRPDIDDSLRYCNFSTGACLDTGCDSGWFGEFCNIRCSQTCTGNICDRDGQCDFDLGCLDKYYGFDCSNNCKETCNDDTCDRSDGECAECNKTLAERTPLCRTAACPPPKKGLMCNENCPDECFGGICQRYNSTCESCNDGFYGDFCQEDCGACVDNICNQETGVCDKQCRPGYYGDKCENICLHPGCYTCDHLTGECTECKATKYGENCDESCSSFCLESNDGQIYCDRDNGDCVENACAPGYHMTTCIRSCNDNCFPDQNGDKPCDIDDGSCDLGCAMYYYGDQCNQECSGNCLAGTCQRNGDCIGGCKTGFFASDCELTCSLKLTCTDRTCDIDTGKCTECDEPDRTHLCREADCPVGSWGEFCNETCPSHCADNKCRREGGSCIGCDVTYYGSECDERCFYCVDDVCIQNDGTCEKGCVDGYYGQQCMTPCLFANCKDCTRTQGVCITCEPGYYGASCDRECSPYCEDPATCSKDDGTCDSDACVPGYWSPQCKEPCSPYCNTNQGECDKTSGACAPCIRGYFNVDCTGFCVDRCKNSNCELRADNCIDGCRDGYWGNLCERPCSPNCQGLACHVSTSACLFGCDADRYYGDTCSTECNANCAAGVCNTTGYCTLGCAKGSHGDMCDLQCAEVSKCTDGTCDRQKGICSICDTDPKNILCPQADCNPGLWGNECGKQCASQLCLYNQCHRYDNVCKGCGTGDYGLYCNKSCGHCQTNSGCDQISGTCDQGCSAGWRGDMCMTPCDPLCQTCDRDTGACIACVARRWGLDCEEDCSSHCDFSSGNVYCEKDTGHCQSCEAGYWRPACTDTCPDNCKASDLGDKICTIDNGYCSNGCQLTYYGDRCQLSCSTRCRNQLCVGAQDTCVDGCADGYWGPQCTHQCSSHCGVPGSCSPTDGACYDDCEDGHYGRLCDSECIATCKDGKCDEQGSCPECRVIPIGSGCRVQVCELGFYGHLCEEECPGAYCQNNMCHRLDGDCEDGCLLGYYGLYCTQQCRCDNDGTDECTQTLGECVCKTGRKGIICDEYCSDGCVNRQCSSITGECEFGCNAGRYGPECESSCDNCAGQNCDANSGLCPGDCNVGWYGSRCEQTCLATCPLCDKNSGRCLTCDVDKYGDMCQSTCSDTCAPVAGDRTCRQTDGQCVAGCLAGYYGEFCDKACDNCYDGGACDSNGVCTQGCEAGWWGTKCDEVCGENCARGGSRYEATCRYETGVCDYGCVAGYYGDLCLNPCSDQCLNKVCSALNQCTSGCVTGYYGPGCTSQCEYCQNGACQQGTGNCQDGCQQGRWGPRCTSVCTQTCTNDECDPTYGDCRDCLVTPQGSGCRDIDTPTAAPSTTDELATGAVIGIAAGAVGIVIIFVVLFVYCVVYKRKAHDAKQEIHLPSDLLERMSTMRSHHSTVSSQYPVARVIGDDEKDFAMF